MHSYGKAISSTLRPGFSEVIQIRVFKTIFTILSNTPIEPFLLNLVMLGSRNKNDDIGMMKNFHLALKIMIQAIA